MARSIYGFISFGLSILAAIITLLSFTILFLPGAIKLFKVVSMILALGSLITLLGLLFYYIQSRIFTIKIFKIGKWIHIIILIINM